MTVGLSGKQVTYDYNNRPTNVVFGGQTTTYTYGPDGARQGKTVGGVETFYAGMAEIRDLGGANEQLILQPHPDFRLVDGVASYLHRDHLSSVRLITDAAGQVEQSTSYTPYGDPTTNNTITTTTPEEHSFIGERFDASTGLLYLNARYYDPALGRFMQPDWWNPRRRGVGTNRYSYSLNDPVNLSDRNGNVVAADDLTLFLILMGISIMAIDDAVAKIPLHTGHAPDPFSERLHTGGNGSDNFQTPLGTDETIPGDPNGEMREGFTIDGGGITIFEARGQLRGNLGLEVGDPRKAHHVVPWQWRNHPAVAAAEREGFNLNGAENGAAVDGQAGGHPQYNTRWKGLLDDMVASGLSDSEIRAQIEGRIAREREIIRMNGNWVENN